MKTLLPMYALCAMLAGIGATYAQDTVVVPETRTLVVPEARPNAIVIQPEQKTVIREYVHKNPVASINVLGLELNLGSRVPETVTLHEVPDTRYRYTVIDNRTVLVDPETHEIVEVLN
ncbi:DUF1236 domain-containing protein [Mesorhizobium sp. UC22_110]|jgi:hypothetical protein|uniref:DUF1236 domain-containing protein n=1 Tax=unclassified Mesorhizobium TaxID=325217 RepID=UPI00366F4936